MYLKNCNISSSPPRCPCAFFTLTTTTVLLYYPITSIPVNMLNVKKKIPEVLRPGLEENLATSTILTAN